MRTVFVIVCALLLASAVLADDHPGSGGGRDATRVSGHDVHDSGPVHPGLRPTIPGVNWHPDGNVSLLPLFPAWPIYWPGAATIEKGGYGKWSGPAEGPEYVGGHRPWHKGDAPPR